ncbi:MAG: hypothetical protein A3F70_08580 [Acidobacteria bacterium RIFCSPLOWO2_12_FULL_67_14]|nr:MAG: hypothetical protein A3H29_13790 [Acidobacteria bacterium RIFCSPLOWO2_02_FULL_67_21]OFW41566.1 MAG: hypothetical protein A3F70_08580 [Acidobacteria bacterium RIFCSPLOWO2_12_FULL_67_14]
MGTRFGKAFLGDDGHITVGQNDKDDEVARRRRHDDWAILAISSGDVLVDDDARQSTTESLFGEAPVRRELWTLMWPLYSMKPRSRNLFMKKLMRERVVPTISASVSCDSLSWSGWSSLP